MSKNHDLIEIEVKLLKETEKAIFVEGDETMCWLPKSEVEFDPDWVGTASRHDIELPEWLATEKGLI
jgi:hypothetical protein